MNRKGKINSTDTQKLPLKTEKARCQWERLDFFFFSINRVSSYMQKGSHWANGLW